MTDPLIDDFSIVLREDGEGGKHLYFFSRKKGVLAGFPFWDHADRDLRHFTLEDVPFGSEERAYEEADEGWRIVIFQRGSEVHVWEGDDPAREEYARTFRVDADRWWSAWSEVIAEFHPALSLDEVLGSRELPDDETLPS
jgi:hypothetical protein